MSLTYSVFIIFLFQTTLSQKPVEFDEKGYHFSYKTDDAERTEDGEISEKDGERRLESVRGVYSFITDGKTYRVTYVSDKNGYRAMTVVDEGRPRINVPYLSPVVQATLIGGGLGR